MSYCYQFKFNASGTLGNSRLIRNQRNCLLNAKARYFEVLYQNQSLSKGGIIFTISVNPLKTLGWPGSRQFANDQDSTDKSFRLGSHGHSKHDDNRESSKKPPIILVDACSYAP